MRPLLTVLADGRERSNDALREAVADQSACRMKICESSAYVAEDVTPTPKSVKRIDSDYFGEEWACPQRPCY